MAESGVAVLDSLNVTDFNSNGLLASYGNIYSAGNIFVSTNDTSKYVYIENDGTISCNSIEMNNIVIGKNDNIVEQNNNVISIGNNSVSYNQCNNSISIGNNMANHVQTNNSIIINGSGNMLNAVNSGLYITR